MRIARNRFCVLATLLLGANLIAVAIFLVSRPPLDAGGWSFLERQRPIARTSGNDSQVEMVVVADGLNFALARRPIGGWESASVRVFQLMNLPAYAAAVVTFTIFQAMPSGNARRHSDLATVVFGIVSMAQWLGVSILLSISPLVVPCPAA